MRSNWLRLKYNSCSFPNHPLSSSEKLFYWLNLPHLITTRNLHYSIMLPTQLSLIPLKFPCPYHVMMLYSPLWIHGRKQSASKNGPRSFAVCELWAKRLFSIGVGMLLRNARASQVGKVKSLSHRANKRERIGESLAGRIGHYRASVCKNGIPALWWLSFFDNVSAGCISLRGDAENGPAPAGHCDAAASECVDNLFCGSGNPLKF